MRTSLLGQLISTQLTSNERDCSQVQIREGDRRSKSVTLSASTPLAIERESHSLPDV